MTSGEFNQALRDFHARRPFRPFTVELLNGNRIEIDAADGFGFRDGAAAFITADGRPKIFYYDETAQFVDSPIILGD